jgi:4-amino-4-deoxychorismate lyase
LVLNGELVKNSEARLLANSQAIFFGWGLFETVRVKNGRLCFFHRHIERMASACRVLSMEFKMDVISLQDLCRRLVAANNLKDGALRITYCKESNGVYNTIVTTRENPYTEKHYIEGFRLVISGIKRNQYSLMYRVKSTNYLENILARELARRKGYNDCLFLNTSGHVCECSISNIFWGKNDVIYTPAVECGILPGITRSLIIEMSKRLGLRVATGRYNVEHLMKSQYVFVTNALAGIMPVSKINYTRFSVDSRIVKAIREEYDKLLKAGKI